MKIKIILDHTEVKAMADKMRHKEYSKSKMAAAGNKVLKAYEEFEKVKLPPQVSDNRTTIDDVIDMSGGKVIN